jgi:hypothetical protein
MAILMKWKMILIFSLIKLILKLLIIEMPLKLKHLVSLLRVLKISNLNYHLDKEA